MGRASHCYVERFHVQGLVRDVPTLDDGIQENDVVSAAIDPYSEIMLLLVQLDRAANGNRSEVTRWLKNGLLGG